MRQIEDQLRETIGLDAACLGPSLIQRAIRHRMRSLGLKRIEDYRQFLEESCAEWHELVESVVVTETWFFRDPEAIAAFVRLVREEWLPAHPTSPLRLLSVACSSGEEPFSVVMALLSAGLTAHRLQMEAVDISVRALARAARGVYGRNSFRGKDLVFRGRYFQPSEEGFVLDPVVRNCVRFFQGNFLNDDLLLGLASYDFIFCRNLLIYFDSLMRRKALYKIKRLLAPAGVLFVGPAEQPLAIEYGFTRAGASIAFACRKAGQQACTQKPGCFSGQSGAPAESQLKSELPARPNPDGRPLLRSSSNTSLPLRNDLETARRLADAGRLKEAAEVCEAHLREHQVSARAYYLLGLVRDADGNPGAINCYRKALYLEPNQFESLLQMALLLQKNGDVARARTFKSR